MNAFCGRGNFTPGDLYLYAGPVDRVSHQYELFKRRAFELAGGGFYEVDARFDRHLACRGYLLVVQKTDIENEFFDRVAGRLDELAELFADYFVAAIFHRADVHYHVDRRAPEFYRVGDFKSLDRGGGGAERKGDSGSDLDFRMVGQFLFDDWSPVGAAAVKCGKSVFTGIGATFSDRRFARVSSGGLSGRSFGPVIGRRGFSGPTFGVLSFDYFTF